MIKFNIRHNAVNIEWLWRQRDEIDLDPIYQRKGHIWPLNDKQYLIDSIINRFDIPKLYLADFSYGLTELNQSGQRYAVIDGKQRLLAIFGFLSGEFPLARSFEYYNGPELDLVGKNFDQIRSEFPELSRKILEFPMAVMSVVTDDVARINQLFVRLNTSKPLTGAEFRNAMLGQVPNIIRELVARPFFAYYLPFSTRRSEDKNLAAKLLLIEHRGAPVDTKKRQLNALVQQARDAEPNARGRSGSGLADMLSETESVDLKGSAQRVEKVVDLLEQVFDPRDPLLRQPSQIPVYYWFIRNLDNATPAEIRLFLEDFQRAREQNTLTVKQGLESNPELDRFEFLTRSSNDAGSIRQRHAILSGRWRDVHH